MVFVDGCGNSQEVEMRMKLTARQRSGLGALVLMALFTTHVLVALHWPALMQDAVLASVEDGTQRVAATADATAIADAKATADEAAATPPVPRPKSPWPGAAAIDGLNGSRQLAASRWSSQW